MRSGEAGEVAWEEEDGKRRMGRGHDEFALTSSLSTKNRRCFPLTFFNELTIVSFPLSTVILNSQPVSVGGSGSCASTAAPPGAGAGEQVQRAEETSQCEYRSRSSTALCSPTHLVPPRSCPRSAHEG
jgi:hypothetical protein